MNKPVRDTSVRVQHWLKLSTLALLLLAMPTPGLSYDALVDSLAA